MQSNELLEKLSNFVSPLIGHTIGVKHIHTDDFGWEYYIPEKSLQANHPLILSHYRGPLFMVIPFEDFDLLLNEKITVENYVNNSYWCFGYYWGGGSMLYGAKWQPLEEGPGIHNTEKIKRYLEILTCRTFNRSSGHIPTSKECIKCFVERCPFSRYEPKYRNSSWENEVLEADDRIKFFEVVKVLVKEKFGLDTLSCLNQKENTIALTPCYKKNTVDILLPESLLIDMLYNPGKYNITETVNSLKLELIIPWHYENNVLFEAQRINVPENLTRHENVDFWHNYWKEWLKDSWFKN